jgi:hypothetical protein
VSFCGSVPNKVLAGHLLEAVGGSEADIQPAGTVWRHIYIRVSAPNAVEAIRIAADLLRKQLGSELKGNLTPVSANWQPSRASGWPQCFVPNEDVQSSLEPPSQSTS